MLLTLLVLVSLISTVYFESQWSGENPIPTKVDHTATDQAIVTGTITSYQESARLREEPSTDSQLVGHIRVGVVVQINGRNSTTEWLQIHFFDGKESVTAWIYRTLVTDIKQGDQSVTINGLPIVPGY